MHRDTMEAIEEQVSDRLPRLTRLPSQHEHDVQSQVAADGGGNASEIRLKPTADDERVHALCQCAPDDELQLADLVTAQAHPRQVIALEENPRSTQELAQARRLLERSGKL